MRSLAPLAVPAAVAILWAGGASAQTAPTLKGVVLLSEPEQVVASGWVQPVDGVDASRLSPALRGQIQVAAAPFLGRPLTGDTLAGLKSALAQTLKVSDYPFSAAVLPGQQASGGVVQILLTEGRLDKVSVKGARRFDAAQYSGAVTARPGQPIDKAVLDRDLAWINRNPFRRATAVAAPGGPFGTVDLTVEAHEKRPWSLSASLDDTGTDLTDPLRVGLSATWGDAFGRGDLISYQLSASPDFRKSVGHSLSLQSFLPWRHVLTASASYATVEGDLPAPFTMEGYNGSVALDYQIPLDHDQAIAFAAAFKRSNNNFRFSDFPISDNTADVITFSAAWSGQFRDARGDTALSASLAVSPGGLTGDSDKANYQKIRTGADARFAVLRVGLDRRIRLPRRWSLSTSLRGQISSSALLGSEQMAFGGVSSVRGYDEGAFYGDQGVLMRNELSAPPVKLGGEARTLSPFLFWDAGWLTNRSRLIGDPKSLTLQSVGLGFNLGLTDRVSARGAWGFPVGEQPGDGQSGRGHFGLVVTF